MNLSKRPCSTIHWKRLYNVWLKKSTWKDPVVTGMSIHVFITFSVSQFSCVIIYSCVWSDRRALRARPLHRTGSHTDLCSGLGIVKIHHRRMASLFQNSITDNVRAYWYSFFQIFLSSGILLSVHRSAGLFSSWYVLPLLLITRQMLVMSSSYFTIEFSGCLGVQPWVYSVNRRGLSSQPWGAPVLSANVEEVWLSVRSLWALLVRKWGRSSPRKFWIW